MTDFVTRFDYLPVEVRWKILNHLRTIIEHRGVGDEWRLAEWDHQVGEITNLLEENKIEMLELTGAFPPGTGAK